MKTRSQVNKGRDDAEASAAGGQPQNLPVKKRDVDVRQLESRKPKMIQKPNRFDTNASSIESHTGVSNKEEGVDTQEERQQPVERQSNIQFQREESSGNHSSPFDRNSLCEVAGITHFVDVAAIAAVAVGHGAFTSIYASPDSAYGTRSSLGAFMSPLNGTSKVSADPTRPVRAGSEQAPDSPFTPTERMTRLSLNDSKNSADAAAEPASIDLVPLLFPGINDPEAQLAMQHASPRGLYRVAASIDTPRASFGSHSPGLNCTTENQLAAHPSNSEAQLPLHHIAPDAQSAAVDQDNGTEEGPKEKKKIGKGKKFKRWTKEEDEKLKAAVNRVGGPPIDWVTVMESFDGERTARQCKTRWKNALSPHINHDPFTKQEDNIIITFRKRGFSWPDIAELMDRRTSEQIRDRFINYINPELKTTPWTKEEDDQLTEAQKRLGNKWTQISKILAGRSEKSIKNRWYNRKTMQSRKARREEIEKARNAKYASIPSPPLVPLVSCDDEKPTSLSVKEDENCAAVGANQKSSAHLSDIVGEDKHPHVIESAEV